MRALVLLPALLCSCAGGARLVDDADLAPLRAAAGPARPATWVVQGAYRDGAGEGDFEDRFADDGRFARQHRSALPGGAGDDGHTPWSLTIDGLSRPAAGRGAREAWVTAAVLSGTWLAPTSSVVVGRRGAHAYDLSVEGELVATLRVDPATALPQRLEFRRTYGDRNLTLGDWRTPLGFPVAHELMLSSDHGSIASWHVRRVTAQETLFTPPPAPDDHSFSSPRSEVPAHRIGTRMVVAVNCEDAPQGWWLVDTGSGSSTVSADLAQRLAWPVVGHATLVGAGGRATRGLRRSGSLRVGAMEVTGLPLVEGDLSILSASLGVDLDGVLGADLLARCVLELDFPAARAWVADPDLWTAPAQATPISFDGRVPLLEASFAPGHRGTLRLDTGSDDTLTFHGPTVRRLGLAYGREDLVTVRVRGLGGEVLGDRGVHGWLETGGQRFVAFPATYLRHSTGGFAREDLAGNLGAALFARHRLVLALPHECIVVE